MPASKTKDYQVLSEQLDEVLLKLQSPEVRVDEALELYQQGLGLVKECETYLTQAENSIKRLKLQATKEDV